MYNYSHFLCYFLIIFINTERTFIRNKLLNSYKQLAQLILSILTKLLLEICLWILLTKRIIHLLAEVSSFSTILRKQDLFAFPISTSYRYFNCVRIFIGLSTLNYKRKKIKVCYSLCFHGHF
jgi:hypothetical protein